MATAIITAIPVPMMYVSVGGKAVIGQGDGVGAAGSTANAVTAWEGQ